MAHRVAILLADLLPAKSHIAQFTFIYRHDASAPDTEVVNYLARKFTSVNNKRCPIVGFGHPAGCNAIAFSLFRLMRTDPAYSNCEAFLIMEADTILTRPNWDKELWEEWEKTKAEGKLACGFVYPGCFGNPNGKHLNAAGLYSSKIARQIPAIGKGKMDIGHDWANGPVTYPVSRDSDLFWMEYRKPTITREELFAKRKNGKAPLFWHGVQDESAIRIVRQEYGL